MHGDEGSSKTNLRRFIKIKPIYSYHFLKCAFRKGEFPEPTGIKNQL